MASVIDVIPEAIVPTSEAVATDEVGAGEQAGASAHAADGTLASPTPAATSIGVVGQGAAGALIAVPKDAVQRTVVRVRTLGDGAVHTIAQVVARAVRDLRGLGATVRVATAA